MAQTAGTAAIDTVQRLAEGIDDLRRRCDAADRDWSTIDISFTIFADDNHSDTEFNAEACLADIDELASAGVTWVQVVLPGDSLTQTLEAIDRFGQLVIDTA
jgi:hypothetical protein